MMRIRIYFQKNEPLRYSSVLDLQKIWERACRRAQLKIEMSKGFNPQAKIQIANPLATGFTGRNEIIDIWLVQNLPIASIRKKISSSLPEGLIINNIESVLDKKSSSVKTVNESNYSVFVFKESLSRIKNSIKSIMQAEKIIRTRNSKQYDLRPLIKSIKIQENTKDYINLFMSLSAGPNRTGRPDEVILEMGLTLADCKIDRLDFS